MDHVKMSQIIRSIAGVSLDELFLDATGSHPTVEQLADVSEFIENKYGVTTTVEAEAEVEETTAPVATIVKPKVTRSYTKRKQTRSKPTFVVDWQDPQVQMFIDLALDGEENTFTFAELNSIMPFNRVSFNVFTSYLRKKAIRRGYKGLITKRNLVSRTVTVQAKRTNA